MSSLRIDGRVALVTGGTRGIGRAIAEALAAQGASVAVTARSGAAAAAAELAATHGIETLGLDADLADPAAAAALIRQMHGRFKRLDILVNNAGIMLEGLIGMTAEETLQAMLAVNVAGTFRLLQSAARLMERSGGGSIVNLSSIIGLRGQPGLSAYAASKAAIVGLTLAAAKELAPKRIRVNAVAPGLIRTDMTDAMDATTRQKTVATIALGREGEAAEVADAVLFLTSDLARYVTGQVLGVDGGMSL